MNHRKNRIILLLVSLFCAQAYAQTPTTSNRVDFISPQLADFVKYGNLQPSLYTGQLGFSIPLFRAKDGDFDVSVALGNNSEGFKPTQATGPVGMNWYLSAGGAISRKVNGYADDCEANPDAGINSVQYSGRGFYLVAKNELPTVDKNDVFNFNIGAVEWGTWNLGYYRERPPNKPTTQVLYDYEPDEFTFSFMGHSGTFFIANDGTPRVISDEHIKVTLDGLATQSVGTLSVPADSYIVLTTADGYKYYFGGSAQYLEYSMPLSQYYLIIAPPIINAWNLAKIVTPSGKELNLSYRSFSPYLENEASSYFDPNHYILNLSTVQAAGFREDVNWFWGHPLKNYGGYNAVGESYSVNKTSYLERIESENFSLVFEYSEKAYKTHPWLSYDYTFFNDKTLQLNNIKYNSRSNGSETLLSSVAFSYNYLGGPYPRHFLTAIQESGKNPYAFTYYNLDGQNPVTLPITATHQIDHWGYWNGQTSGDPSMDMIPDMSVDPSKNGDVVMSGPKRAPNAAYSVVGMLKTVTYPTRGYSTFEYQANDYSNRLERRAASDFLPALFAVDGVAGGVRISKISDYNGTAVENVREYKYKTNYLSGGTLNESAPSSGFLLDYPRYLHFWRSPDFYEELRMRNGSYGTNYNFSEPFANYSEVTEVTNGNGYKVYKYSNYATNPDIKGDKEKDLDPSLSGLIQPVNLYKNYIGYRLNNRARDRGKLRFMETYDVNKNPVSSVENIYTPASTTAYTVGVLACSGMFSQAYKIYEDNPRLEHTISKVWNSGQVVSTTQDFTYDAYGQLMKKSATSSKNELLETIYRYPYDMTGGSDPTGVYLAMKNSHIIGNVITEQTKRSGNQTGYKITNYYMPVSGVFRTQTVQQQSLSTGPLETFASYTHSGVTGWNIESINRPAGPPTSYIWGYNKQYAIAEIKNALVSDVAYTSFETIGDKGGWEFNNDFAESNPDNPNSTSANAVTGKRVYALGHTTIGISKSNLDPSKTYKVTCRYFNGKPTVIASNVSLIYEIPGAKMSYCEFEISNSSSVQIQSGTSVIDELRLYPSDAEMTTYTYEPLVGMTSATDGRGETIYYEYDNFQRLLNVRDKNNKVTKHYEYHYKN